MTTIRTIAILLLIGCLGTVMASAQSYLSKLVVSDAGGVSTNGNTVLRCTVGQPITGSAANATTRGQFGFWNAAQPTAAVGGLAVANTSIELFPNPATRTIRATIQLPGTSAIDIQVVDIHGVVVESLPRESRKGDAAEITLNIDVGSLPSGTYFVVARTADAMAQQSLNVVR